MSSEPKKGRKTKAVERKAEGGLKGAEKEVEKVGRALKKGAGEVEKIAKGGRSPTAKQARPAGRVPVSMVMSRHGTGMISRQGKGFSLGELSGAGIAPGLAARWGLKVDPRRRSIIEGNVGSLRGWGVHSTAASAKKEAEVLEGKVVEVAKEVEMGAEVVEEEAARVEKAAKKVAKKAEATVKEKVERPRARKKKS